MPLASNDLVGFGHGPGPIIVGSTTTNKYDTSGSTNPFVLTTPTGTQPGDLLLLFYAEGGSGNHPLTAAPSGWTIIRNDYNANTGVQMATAYGYAPATVPANFSFTLSASSSYWVAGLLAIRNGVYRQSSYTAGGVSAPAAAPAVSLSNVTPGSLLLWWAGGYYYYVGYYSYTPPAGWTADIIQNTNSSAGYGGMSVGKRENAPGGATGSVVFTLGTSEYQDAGIIEIGAM